MYILCNLYTPTKYHKLDQNNFVSLVNNELAPFENENIIIGGDFNIYLNPKLESMSNKNDNPVYRKNICSLMESMSLTYCFRDIYPNTRRYLLSLAKRNYANKLITTLEIDGKITKEPARIFQEQITFDQNLYSEKINLNDPNYQSSLNEFLQENEIKQLCNDEREVCEKTINESEILKSIKNLSNGKKTKIWWTSNKILQIFLD